MDLREILCDLVNRCVIEINDGDDIKQPIKDKILKPLINYILEQIYPYLIISVIIFAFKGLRKNIIGELKENEENMDEFVKNHGNKMNILLIFNNDIITTPNVTLLTKYDKLMQKKKGMLQYFQNNQLLFNPTKHEIVPNHRKLSPEETAVIMEKYLIKSKLQIPIIMHNDVIAKWLGLKQGELVEITRYNENSGISYYYRCCI